MLIQRVQKRFKIYIAFSQKCPDYRHSGSERFNHIFLKVVLGSMGSLALPHPSELCACIHFTCGKIIVKSNQINIKNIYSPSDVQCFGEDLNILLL